MKTEEYILEQYKRYPKSILQDYLKFLYQSSFGCEHFVQDTNQVSQYLFQEASNNQDSFHDIEYLDGNYVRIHLNYGLNMSTLAKLFILSASPEKDGKENLEIKLQVLLSMISNQKLPLDYAESQNTILSWKEKGYPSLHHSQVFHDTYHPAYRLIKKEYVPFLPVFKEVDCHHPKILSIDGRCASGKTTLANLLQTVYQCPVFHMDDFFLQPNQRTKERLLIPGENIDHERFLKEVLIPLKEKKPVVYRPYDCSTCTIQKGYNIQPSSFNIVEGSYCMHKTLEPYYDDSIFLTINENKQIERIKKRNPNMVDSFIHKWIPLEEAYFNTCKIQEKCNLTIDTTKA